MSQSWSQSPYDTIGSYWPPRKMTVATDCGDPVRSASQGKTRMIQRKRRGKTTRCKKLSPVTLEYVLLDLCDDYVGNCVAKKMHPLNPFQSQTKCVLKLWDTHSDSLAGLIWWRSMLLPATRSRWIWRSSGDASCCRGRRQRQLYGPMGFLKVSWDMMRDREISWDTSASPASLTAFPLALSFDILVSALSWNILEHFAQGFLRVSGNLKPALLWKKKSWCPHSIIPLRSTRNATVGQLASWRKGQVAVP